MRRYLAAAFSTCTALMLVAPAHAATEWAPKARFDALVTAAKADMMVDPARAVVRAQQAITMADEAPTAATGAIMRATALWLVGEAQSRLNHPKEAVALLTRAERLAARVAPDTLLYADTTLSLGAAMTDMGQVTESLVTLQRAHQVYVRLHQPRGQAKALILIALLYSSARDNISALRYFQQAIDTHLADNALAISLYIGRGTAFSELGRYGEAEQSLRRAVDLAQQMDSDALQALALGNLANVELRAGHVAAAERSVTRGAALTTRQGAEASRPAFLMLSAKVALLRGHVGQAEAAIAHRFSGIDLSTTTLNDREAHQTAYDVYSRLGRAPEALAHLAALKRLDDQATEIARSNGAALAAAKFDYTNQELRIAKLKADDLQKSVAFERDSARTQRTIFLGTGLATLLVIVLLAVGLLTIRRSRNQARNANAELETSNAALGKALAAKTEFLATTSHEIRTPLNGILGMTQVMAADPALDAATRDRLAVVHGAGVTMRALVDDILDVAKIESGKMSIEDTAFDLAATIDEAARLWGDQARDKGLAFAVDAGPTTWLMGDPARLRQIVFNLLSNAVKFTSVGHVRLDTAIADGRVRITVADTGIGIDAAAHEMIFEMFRQADTTTTRRFGGTGLGLSICRNLARAMGGDVTVESRLGEGAVFTLDLPARQADDPTLTQDVAVVIVERNPIARATLRAALEPHGALAFADSLLDAEATVRRTGAGTLLVDHASVAGDEAGVAALAARTGVHALLLLPAGVERAVSDTGAVTVLQRPIAKKILVAHVFCSGKSLVRDAA